VELSRRERTETLKDYVAELKEELEDAEERLKRRLCRLRLCLWDRFVLSLHTTGAWRPSRSAAASVDPRGAQT